MGAQGFDMSQLKLDKHFPATAAPPVFVIRYMGQDATPPKYRTARTEVMLLEHDHRQNPFPLDAYHVELAVSGSDYHTDEPFT